MLRCLQILALLLVLVFCFWNALHAEGESFVVTVKQHDTYDFKGVQFFELRFSDGTAATVSVDGNVPFASVLRSAQGKQTLQLQPFTLREVSR